MRNNISAQSHASVPPAPALMLMMQLLRSCGPLRNTRNSSASRSLRNFATSRSNSRRTFGCAAGGSAWPSSTITRKSSRCFSASSSGSILPRRELASSMSFCACSRLFQKLSAAISESSSPRRFCVRGTSKKPPQMGQFLGGGAELRNNRVEHASQNRGGGFRMEDGNSQDLLLALVQVLRFEQFG